MKAIETRYIGATNTKGSRIKATSEDMTCTISYDYGLNDVEVHFKAVCALVAKYKLDWDISTMVWGGTKAGLAFCFPQSTIKLEA